MSPLDRVRVMITDSVRIPFSARARGICWVVIPSYLLPHSREMRLALRHEIQHHRQGDTLWAVFIEWLSCLFFPNPGIHLWKRRIVELQELSCDEALIGQRKVSVRDYGSCLLRVAEGALGSRSGYAGTACLAAASRNPFHVKSFLRRRIEMFSSHGRLRPRFWVGALIGTTAMSLTVMIAFAAEQSFRNGKAVNPGTLTVDPAIQAITDRVLSDALNREKAGSGFAIVTDPNTGRILAVSNIDPTQPSTGHWALSQEFEQGSVFKTISTAYVMDQGLTNPMEQFGCENGNYLYNGRIYHDWKQGGWASLTTTDAIVNSSDICSMKIAERVGPEGIRRMLGDFGFGPGGTARSLPEARPGELPSPEDEADIVPMVEAGFGFKSTPLEMLQAYGAIANGGNLMMPKPANDPSPQLIRRVLTSETARKAREILRQVVLRGTGKKARSPLYTTAGKTSSVLLADTLIAINGGESDFGGFIGFAPVQAPRVEIYVGIRAPHDRSAKHGAHGGSHAAPVFQELVEQVLKTLAVPPDQPQG